MLEQRNFNNNNNSTNESLSIPMPENKILVLQQCFLFTLVLTKWIAPKGGVTLDNLSELLLINVGAAADILELKEMDTDTDSVSDYHNYFLV